MSGSDCGPLPPPTAVVLKDWQPSPQGGGEFWFEHQGGGLKRRFLWGHSGLKERQ